jgi:Adaptin N terminal region/Beta2-adaptin appendage, C-terminal sub-domain
VVQKRPYLLEKDYKYFYVQYNDPVYVKLEKIDILYKLTDGKNYDAIIGELKNYSITEFDIDFVKKAIRYIGNIGFKFDKSVDACVDAMKEILDHNQDFAVNEAIIICRDLMRKYKGKTLDLIKKITSDGGKNISEPEAKAAFLYIVGEFCLNIPKSTELVSPFVESFCEEEPVVKLQILNAIIKNYVNKPEETEDLIKQALQKGGEETENPDVRDRAYVYWRLLENEPDVAKDMIMAEKPPFEFIEDVAFEGNMVDNITENMTNISAVYHKMSHELIVKEDMIIDPNLVEEEKKEVTNDKEKSPKKEDKEKQTKIDKKEEVKRNETNLIPFDEFPKSQQQQNPVVSNPPVSNDIFEIFGKSQSNPIVNSNPFESGSNFQFIEENLVIFDSQVGINFKPPIQHVSATTQGSNGRSGLSVHSTFNRINGVIYYGMILKNNTSSTLNNFSLSFKINSFGIVPLDKLDNLSLTAGAQEVVKLRCTIDNEKFDKKTPPSSPFKLDVGVACNLDLFVFQVDFLINTIFSENGRMKKENFIEFLKDPSNKSATFSINLNHTSDSLKQVLEKNNIFLVAQVNKPEHSLIYYSLTLNNINSVTEISLPKKGNQVGFKTICLIDPILPLIREVIEFILK